jgi:glycosyltransferase involved in cell wall biosynthesis
MGTPLVTVVTPVFNGEAHLTECVESVRAQTYERWEYVIADNRSTDGTPELASRLAAEDPRIRYVRFEEFVDVTGSHNRAVALMGAESAYCKLLGADDWLFPACLEKMVALGERHPKVGVVSSYRQNGDVVDLRTLPEGRETCPGAELIARGLRSRFALTGAPSALLFRSQLVRARTPFYNPSFRHSDSESAYWALTQSDYGVVHEVLTFNRVASPETVSSDALGSYLPERLRLLVRYGPAVLPQNEYRQELRRQLRAYVRVQARLFAWWHTKGRFSPDRPLAAENRGFNRRAVQLLLAEAGADRDVRRALRPLQLLLR